MESDLNQTSKRAVKNKVSSMKDIETTESSGSVKTQRQGSAQKILVMDIFLMVVRYIMLS